MARKTQAQAGATRQRILDAAAEVFAERGWANSALQDVAQRAGVTRGAVYGHFRDRRDLLAALVVETQLPWQVVRPLIRGTQQRGMGAVRIALLRMGAAPLNWLETSVRAQRLQLVLGSWCGAAGCPQIATMQRDHRQHGLTCYRGAVAYAADQGLLRMGLEPAIVALGWFDLVDGLMQHWLAEPGSFGLVEVGNTVMSTYWAGALVSTGASPAEDG